MFHHKFNKKKKKIIQKLYRKTIKTKDIKKKYNQFNRRVTKL